MRRTFRLALPAALCAVALAVSIVAAPRRALAVSTTYWTVTRAEDFEKGTLEGVSVETPGTVLLAPKATAHGEVQGLYAWSLARDAAGNLFVGTGDGGKVFRVSKDGETEDWFDSIEMEITSVAVARDGTVYAGGSPDGTIFKITGKGQGGTLVDTPESYIWALAFDETGTLYAATGTRGRIYKIGKDGAAQLFYEAEDVSILSLVYDAHRKAFLAGTQGRGLVIAVGTDGEGRVLFDSGHEEIGAITVAADGTIYFGGSGGGVGGDAGSKKGKAKSVDVKAGRDETTASAKLTDGDADDSAGKTDGNATVYKIAPDDVVTRLWESKAEFLYALAIGESGDLIAATGSEGKVYRISADGRGTLLTKLVEAQVLDVVGAAPGFFAATGNMAKVYRIGPETEAKGTVRSDVYDARSTARWGSVSWLGDAPEGTEIVVRVRGGNTEKPDATWTDWSAPLSDATGSPIDAGRSRFLQWEAELRSGRGSATPRLSEVRVAFVQANLPPSVKDLVVFPSNTVLFEGDPDDRPKPVFQVLPNGVLVEFSNAERDNIAWNEASNPWARAMRTMRWDGIDPNNDILSYDLSFRAADETKWKTLKEKQEATLFSWDTESFPDGEYRVRVVASDRLENTTGDELTAEAISEPFFVDHTPPEIAGFVASREGDGRIAVRATARDTASYIKRALYAIDAKDWVSVGVKDGIFDSREEALEFRSEKQEDGEHTVVLKVFDESGNTRVARTVVR